MYVFFSEPVNEIGTRFNSCDTNRNVSPNSQILSKEYVPRIIPHDDQTLLGVRLTMTDPTMTALELHTLNM